MHRSRDWLLIGAWKFLSASQEGRQILSADAGGGGSLKNFTSNCLNFLIEGES